MKLCKLGEIMVHRAIKWETSWNRDGRKSGFEAKSGFRQDIRDVHRKVHEACNH